MGGEASRQRDNNRRLLWRWARFVPRAVFGASGTSHTGAPRVPNGLGIETAVSFRPRASHTLPRRGTREHSVRRGRGDNSCLWVLPGLLSAKVTCDRDVA